MAFGQVSKYIKDMLSVKTYENPSSATMPLSNSLLQTILFHELAISIRPLPTFYFQKRLGVLLTLGTHLSQSHLHSCALQKTSQNLGIVKLMLTTTSPRGWPHFVVHPSIWTSFLSSKLVRDFVNAKKYFMNFLWKLVNLRNDLTPFIEIKLCHSLIDSIFLGSGLTPSLDNTCPQKSISGLAKSLFA